MNEYISPISGSSVGNQHITDLFKALGQKIAQIVRQDGQYLSPLLAAYTARMITLEQTGRFPVEGVNAVSSLPPVLEDELIQMTIDRALSQNDPLFETVKLQITFESFYAMELHRLRAEELSTSQHNTAMIDAIIQVGSSLVSSQQVATLYRMMFKLLLANSAVPETNRDKNVEREVAIALESVFPQASLNSFSLSSAEEKRKQLLNMVDVVLGIRLFNKEIRHGGAGLDDVPSLCGSEMDSFYGRLEAESQEMSDISFTLTDLVNLEYQRPGTLYAPIKRLQDELVNRRQYVLLLHQLQHEVLESLDTVKKYKVHLDNELNQVKAIVGLRSAVPKEQVYPLFHVIATSWRAIEKERVQNQLRIELLSQLQQFRNSFAPVRVDEDLPSLKLLQPESTLPLPVSIGYTATGAVDVDSFVETIVDSDAGSANVILSTKPQRLVKETTLNFMMLPLENQGYCPWTLVMRAGLLLPGDPALGIIRYKGRHYSFASYLAMHDFCLEPEKYTEGLIMISRHQPALIHLLGLQPLIPNSDIADFFTMQDLAEQTTLGSKPCVDAQTQITHERINTDIADPHYEWNEWKMREKIIQMANLYNMKTISTQTHLSHFRRDSTSQTDVKPMNVDGTMPGTGTQTNIEKGTNVDRVEQYHFGLRGQKNHVFRTVKVVHDDHVVEGTNNNLMKLASKIVTRPIIREV